MQHQTQPDSLATEAFPTEPSGLPEAERPQLLELGPGDTLDLRVGPVAKRLGDTTVRMLGYNGSIPGPTLKVQQGSEIIVHGENHGDLDTTVHWHGLRLGNKLIGLSGPKTSTLLPSGSLSIQNPGCSSSRRRPRMSRRRRRWVRRCRFGCPPRPA
jgi:FtsP/CotA-like multicopper oxidase with cupredoxin domain